MRSQDMHYSIVLGVPSRNADKEAISFQGVDRLVNIMSGLPFHMLVVWEPVPADDLKRFDAHIKDIYGELSALAKYSIQESRQESEQHGSSTQSSRTDNKSRTKGESYNSGENSGDSSKSTGRSVSDTTGSSKTTGEGASWSKTTGSSASVTTEKQNKYVSELIKYMDDELLPRLRQGQAKGMYETAVYLGSRFPADLTLLENAVVSIYQGDKSTFCPLHVRRLPQNETVQRMVSSFSIYRGVEAKSSLLPLHSRPVLNSLTSLGTWLTPGEVSILAGMPQKEVPGLELREQVGFGLNVQSSADEKRALYLGRMYHEGALLKERKVSLDKSELTKHIFVAGTTGSGKTTTCHRLLAEAKMPFMVIEPAKTEYRALLNDPTLKNVLVFTIGNERGVPFRFNPFEFLPEESLSGHVDLLRACFMASFDMEAAIPNLLEEALYRTYEAFGWDFRNDGNKFLENRNDAWQCGGAYFPTITDYIHVIATVVEGKGFNDRLRDEYLGSIRARLDSLRTGVKGLMLDTRLSVDFNQILDSRVIFELEELKSGEDKAFIIGLVLGRLVEALKNRHEKDPAFRHITLVEEAHRLLTRIMPGDSANRKLGVETFADLLAEVRKYGESLIIVDQIPSKLAPEVLKNTNTKIIHKLFARDDKDAVGDTMALSEKQRDYLSHLLPGEAIVFSQGWKKPVDIQVEPLEHARTDDTEVPKKHVYETGWGYWRKNPQLFCPGFPSFSEGGAPFPELDETALRDLAFWSERIIAPFEYAASGPIDTCGTENETLLVRAGLLLEARRKIFAGLDESLARPFFEMTLRTYFHRRQMKKYSGKQGGREELDEVMRAMPKAVEFCAHVETEEQARKAIEGCLPFF